MTRHLIVFAAVLSMVGTTLADSRLGEPASRRAISENEAEAAKAIAELRAMGPEGLKAFVDANDSEIRAAIGNPGPRRERVLSALDSIAAQKDAYASRLYWYTDLDKARAAAKATGKPILSLRMLGRLDQDLSCANSRFFRIVLYANSMVSQLLRDKFVLHWQTVRPVPRVTIDFGDGRKLERTLTGNSIHYVLDQDGRVVDALPGLYGPVEFVEGLTQAERAAARLSTMAGASQREAALREYHQQRLSQLKADCFYDMKRAGLATMPSTLTDTLRSEPGNPPSASIAASRAVAKVSQIERPVLRGMSERPAILDSIGTDPGWSAIAALHADGAQLDQSTRDLMVFKDPSLKGAKLEIAVQELQRVIAEDTVRNEYVFHAKIHNWLTAGAAPDLERLNERVYSELFLTPSWDEWLGLRPRESYSGLDNDGVVKR
ncbi:MAG TPA: hypothetical protein VKM94_09440 [Blastocatellia bacterium]|nr:hypothetical protein [Blastocatellia bacterium]